MKIGVIDAAKVTRSALQNAASIAALFLTTEAVVADKPEKDAAGHARWRHGGLLSVCVAALHEGRSCGTGPPRVRDAPAWFRGRQAASRVA